MSKQFFIFVSLVILIVSCQNNTQPTSLNTKPTLNNTTKATTNITIYATGNTMTEMAFEPNVITAKPGGTIKLKLINKGTDKMMIHNIIFTQKGKADEIGVKAIRAGEAKQYVPKDSAVIAASALVGPADSTVLQFTTPEIGTYPFICSYPGHYLKMRGRLVVKP